MATILIADDEANLRKVLCAQLKRSGHTAVAVPDAASAIDTLRDEPIDLLITDLRMPGRSGLELLADVRRSWPHVPVIVITAHGTVDTAVRALRQGAIDYITKPFDKEELRLAVRKGLAASAGERPLQGTDTLSDRLQAGDGEGRYGIIGRSASMQTLFEVISKVAATPSTVLITGESGTGKELVASALHNFGERKQRPFITVNCAAIPDDLIESEFFGHEKGAFTGAVRSKPGRFELADGGTLFLDEIAEVPPSIQVKLLRALQSGEFERVGGIETLRVNVRVIAATNRDLQRAIAEGLFREDLFYRLNVVPIVLPPLRDRCDDIPLLATSFVAKLNKRLGRDLSGLTEEAIAVLKRYPWPGNIRELENVIERTLLFAESDPIAAVDLPAEIKQVDREDATPPTAIPSTLAPGSAPLKEIVRQATADIERELIARALEETSGNVTRAAHLLRISRKGMQNKMKEFGLREEIGDTKE